MRIIFSFTFVFLGGSLRAAPPVTAVAYSPDGTRLAAGSRGVVQIVDAKTGDIAQTQPDLTGRITSLAWGKSFLAAASGEPGKDGVVTVFDANLKPLGTLPPHKDSVYALAFTPDGTTLATAGYDRVIRLWKLGPKLPTEPALTLTDHSDAVYAIAFHPTKMLLASGSADRAVKVWDATSGKRLYTLADSTDWVYTLAWSPDGTRLAAAGVDKSVRVWKADETAGTLEKAAYAHTKGVLRLGYAGNRLYSAGEDRVVKAWDPATLGEAKTFPAEESDVLAFAVRSDGQQYAVGRYDGTLRLVDTTWGKALIAKPKPPTVTAVSPPFVVRGRTTRLTLIGSRIESATGLTLTGVPNAKAVRMNSTEFDLTLPTDTPLGAIQLKLTSPAGDSAPIPLMVLRYPVVEPAAGLLPIPSSIPVALSRPGDVYFVRVSAVAGQELGFQVTPTGPIDPVLTLTDPAGTEVASAPSDRLGYVVKRAGTYTLSVRDREYRGGSKFGFYLHAGDVPVIAGVFPLAVPAGVESTIHVAGMNLGGPGGATATVYPPKGAKPGTFVPVRYPGDKMETARVAVAEFPSVVVSPGSGATLKAVPGSADGILLPPGAAQTVRFPANKGQPVIVEVLAQRYGAPTDPMVEILDASGSPVPRAVLRCVAKTNVTFRDHDSTQSNIRIDAWNELATNDYLYVGGELMRIKQLPGHPDADCSFWQVAGKRIGFLDTTPTHHAQNAPMYKVEIHPPGTTFPPNGMPVFSLPYRNDDGGPGYGKDSRLFFDPPADGIYQARVSDARGVGGPNHAYRLTVRPPRPDFSVSVNPSSPKAWKGSTLPLAVTATRADGFDGEVAVELIGLPAGVTSKPTVVDAGLTTATLGLSANTDAKLPEMPGPVKLVAKAMIAGKEVTREFALTSVGLVDAGDIVTTLDRIELTIRPGHEARFVVKVERRNGFKGRIPLDVLGLPHGVTVQNIGLNGILITERDTEREVVLRAEPWVKPKTVPIVPAATREGKAGQHGAALVLKVGN